MEVGHGGGESPGAKGGLKFSEAGEGEFGLHATLGAHEFVPFIDDDAAEGIEFGWGVGVRKQKRNAFGSGDEDGGKAFSLAFADGGGGVGGAEFDGAVQVEAGVGEL